jgi:fucose permease
MFMTFAMTTDSVGVVIPQIVAEFGLSLTAAGAFHYATMTAIALAGILLGFCADRVGHKQTIAFGLALFAFASCLFAAGRSYVYFLCLLSLSGVAIGLLKTGALALIGDISSSTTAHTTTMNLAEGFFGVGAIVGPAIVASLLRHQMSWRWLYVLAGILCVVLLLMTLVLRFPDAAQQRPRPAGMRRTLRMLTNPYALAFGTAIALYVAIEASVYVWGPLYLQGYRGNWSALADYAIAIFFVLRAAGRFLGVWVLARLNWSWVLVLLGLALFVCLATSVVGGVRIAVALLPLSGLFMSVVYPTLNSKAMSCFPRAEHGAISGVTLFFTCAGAVLGPLVMGAVIDVLHAPKHAFTTASALALLLLLGFVWNACLQPTKALLGRLDAQEYGA